MGYVYKIVNDINDKVYVGKTHGSLQERWSDHVQQSYRLTEQHRPLYQAMNKYGIEHFTIQLIEETDYPEEREMFWIRQLHSYTHDPVKGGYNATLGGDGRPWAFSTNEEVQLLIDSCAQGMSVYAIAQLTHHDPHTVLVKMQELGLQRTVRDIHSSDNGSNHRIECVDKKTGEVLYTFTSAREAARVMFEDEKRNTHIAEAARGVRKSAYGYQWRYID